jgi:cytochrome c-type biogenesis protein CcmH
MKAFFSLALVAAALSTSPGPSGLDSEDRAYIVGKAIRCPVCQGMPIAESPSPMAQDMMQQVRRMLAAGKTPEEVKQYYVERYGEWVLLRPVPQGFGWVVWLAPPAGILCLGIVSYLALRRRLPSLAAAAPQALEDLAPASDPYRAAIEQELQEGPDA